jgi:hypothetical protein
MLNILVLLTISLSYILNYPIEPSIQLFYLMSRGISEEEATEMIVMGFIEPFTKELPMEYAVEMNRLIKMVR